MTKRQSHKFNKGQRVRLVRDALYPLAPVGMEGWVRDLQYDNLGYPMIFIQWDKDHWAYNGEGDEWTMEAHFESVEGEKMHEDDMDPLERLLREIGQGQNEDAEIPQDQRTDGLTIKNIMDMTEWPTREEYQEMLKRATDNAMGDEAFLFITIRREEGNLVPILTNVYLNAESAILLEAQLSRIGALAHSDLASQLISLIFTERENDDETG